MLICVLDSSVSRQPCWACKFQVPRETLTKNKGCRVIEEDTLASTSPLYDARRAHLYTKKDGEGLGRRERRKEGGRDGGRGRKTHEQCLYHHHVFTLCSEWFCLIFHLNFDLTGSRWWSSVSFRHSFSHAGVRHLFGWKLYPWLPQMFPNLEGSFHVFCLSEALVHFGIWSFSESKKSSFKPPNDRTPCWISTNISVFHFVVASQLSYKSYELAWILKAFLFLSQY